MEYILSTKSRDWPSNYTLSVHPISSLARRPSPISMAVCPNRTVTARMEWIDIFPLPIWMSMTPMPRIRTIQSVRILVLSSLHYHDASFPSLSIRSLPTISRKTKAIMMPITVSITVSTGTNHLVLQHVLHLLIPCHYAL